MSRPVPADRAARIAADFIIDIVRDGWAKQWRARADDMDWCRPRADDFPGRAPRETPAERNRRLDELASACRNRAAVIELERAW